MLPGEMPSKAPASAAAILLVSLLVSAVDAGEWTESSFRDFRDGR